MSSRLRKTLSLLAVSTLVCVSAEGAVIGLFDFGLNKDGTTYCNLGPCDNDGLPGLSGIPGVNDAAFDFTTGLGSIAIQLTGAGPHNVDFFVDHDIDALTNSFFNELGASNSSPSAGQSWEIDEPGFIFGDIIANYLSTSLDNSLVFLGPEDISMALGWDFSLLADEIATITFRVSDTTPGGGFFISHTDPDSNASIYFSSSLAIAQQPAIPEPGTLILLVTGILGLGAVRRR